MANQVKMVLVPRPNGYWEYLPSGWIWRGNVTMVIIDPRHTVRGSTVDEFVANVSYRDFKQNDPAFYHGIWRTPMPPVVARDSGEDHDEGSVDDPAKNPDSSP
ncbi:hypothetical protein RIF29_15848 [Crotalaria pallida]|uniref:Uncharacterized protein n=1 Tax=Crotalaria pallida TaxID=3830 RepID=A0AAN9IF14_CROPI